MIDDTPGRWPERSSMRRVHYPHTEQEDVQAGMWERPSAKERAYESAAAAALMRRPAQFEAAMLGAVRQWPRACEHNLTAISNRRAWIGHAGCFLVASSRESSTRDGWHLLSREEQREANAAADRAIATWSLGRPGAVKCGQQLPLWGG